MSSAVSGLLSLTPEGEVFHERCRQLLDGIVKAEAYDLAVRIARLQV